jgi:hypothetical protein
MPALLSQIQTLLEQEEYPFLHVSATDNIPYERLLVSLGVDQKKRDLKVEVTEHTLPVLPKFASSADQTLPSKIQFRLILPFKVKNSSLNDISSLLHFLNQSIDLPGFGLDELEGRVIYRYVWLTSPSHLDKISIITLLNALTLNLMLFSDTIESIAKGSSTFNDLLSEIVSKFKSSHPS